MKRLMAFLVFLVVFLEVSQVAFAMPLQRGWSWVSQNPPPWGLYSVVFGKGVWVAVGEQGAIVRSTDGVRWDPVESGMTYQLRAVTYGTGQFVAVGSPGIILTSGDGETWVPQVVRRESWLTSVVHGVGQYVAVGSSGTVATSVDGRNWAFAQIDSLRGASAITYGNGKYVAVGRNMTAVSTDGKEWTVIRSAPRPTREGEWNTVAFGNGKFVAAGAHGAVTASADGSTWRLVLPGRETYDISSLIFADGQFLAAAHGSVNGRVTLLSSIDGESWSAGVVNGQSIYGLAFGEGQYVAVGSGTVLTRHGSGPWEHIIGLAGFRRVAFQNGSFFALSGQAQVATSEDGRQWVQHTVETVTSSKALGTVVFAQGRYFMPVTNDTILTSTNALHWERWTGSPKFVGDMAYGSGTLVGVATSSRATDQPIVVLTDPLVNTQWQSRRAGGIRELSRIAYGASRFVAVGPRGAVVSSTDGIDWAIHETGTSARLSAVAFGNGLFVVVGQDGTILTSSDGTTWTRRRLSTQSLLDVAYGDGLFVVVGAGIMHWSSDGTHWQSACLPSTEKWIQSIAFGNGHFVAVGSSGGLLSATSQELTQGAVDEPDLIESSFVASSQDAKADGVTEVLLNLTLLGPCREPLQGWTAHIQSSSSQSMVKPSSVVTDGAGRASFIATSRAAGTVTYSALVGPEDVAVLETASVTFSGCVTPFSDVAPEAGACPAIAELAARKVIGGFPDGTFRPSNPVTRAEFAKMLVLALGKTPVPKRPAPFRDAVGHWSTLQGYLQAVHELGAISGAPDGNFSPDRNVTRAEVVKIVAASTGLAQGNKGVYLDVLPSHWAFGWAATATQARLVGPSAPYPLWGEAALSPEQPVTRAEAAMVLGNLRR